MASVAKGTLQMSNPPAAPVRACALLSASPVRACCFDVFMSVTHNTLPCRPRIDRMDFNSMFRGGTVMRGCSLNTDKPDLVRLPASLTEPLDTMP